jgi:hypothetical protein
MSYFICRNLITRGPIFQSKDCAARKKRDSPLFGAVFGYFSPRAEK